MDILARIMRKRKAKKMTVAQILDANLKAGQLRYVWEIPFQGEPQCGASWGGAPESQYGLEARYR